MPEHRKARPVANVATGAPLNKGIVFFYIPLYIYAMKNIDFLTETILESYDKYGAINLSETEGFPNRENVISALSDIQALIFPGFRRAEYLDSYNLRYITGERINRITAVLTQETQKALIYLKKRCGGLALLQACGADGAFFNRRDSRNPQKNNA